MFSMKCNQWVRHILLSYRLFPVFHRQIFSGGVSTSEMADTKSELISEYVDVNGVETHVLKYGSLQSPPPHTAEGGKKQHVFLIIPGNPGIPEYYEQFMHTLWLKSDRKIPVWCVGHAGHVTGPKHAGLGWTDIVREPENPYTLKGQITHKADFIKAVIPPDSSHYSLILVGHSIGCYIILNLLADIPRHHVLRCFFLFPTIERMAQTPNGKVFTPALNYFRWALTAAVKCLSYLGPKLHRKLLEYHFSGGGGEVPECAVLASLNLFNPACVNHATFMAKQEMNVVSDLQATLLEENLHRISFYYGAIDRWCPKQFCTDLKERFPEADARLCQMDFPHAFVLDAGHQMADIVWDWVEAHL